MHSLSSLLCLFLLFAGGAPFATAQDTEAIVSANEPAAVVIVGTREENGAQVQSSGCCVHPDGYVLTTAHQIDGVKNFVATFSNGEQQPLSVVDFDTKKEIALLKTQAPVQHWAKIGNSDTLKSGSPLVAIATPLNMSFSSVRGMVSSTSRTYNGYPVLQADLPASHGSSGGSVFDRYGNLVGMIIGMLKQDDRVTLVNVINNAFPMLEKHGVLQETPGAPALLVPTAQASAVEKGAIEAYNAGVSAPDPSAKVTAYAEALKLMPNFFEALFNQGVAYGRLENVEKAEEAYRKAEQLRPESVEVKRNLGRLLLHAKRLEEAKQEFEGAARLAPDAPQSHNDFGEACRQLGQYEEAVSAFERALALNPAYPQARYNLGLAHMASGNGAEALREFGEYLKLQPTPEDAESVRALVAQLKQTADPSAAQTSAAQ